MRRTGRTTKPWEHRKAPGPMWVPAKARAVADSTEFYLKPPHEMSRYELEELERALAMTEEERLDAYHDDAPKFDAEGNQLPPAEAFKLTEEYRKAQVQVRALQPYRLATFTRQWRKMKNIRRKRDAIMRMMDASDEQAGYLYGEGFVGWRDAVPGAREFIAEVEDRQQLTETNKLAH